ncbi:MAG: hypothetical protein M3P42_04980 [Actinomycetota bacterium]|nr:hypothetical protein [Actinomycetota bacterium]
MGKWEVRVSGQRRFVTVGVVALLALVGVGSAFAATPQQIYRDLADNNRLDGKYTPAELEHAFNLHQVTGTDKRKPQSPRKPIGESAASGGVQAPRATPRTNRRVPFSALDAALLVAGGGPLLLIGAGLRRRMVPARTEAPVVSG